MKKILISLGLIALGSINFSSASFTAVISNQTIQQWNNVNVSDIYNQYGEGFLCITSLNQGYSVVFYDNYWNILNSIQITTDNGGTACVLVDSSIAFFNNNGGNAYFNYYIAGQSSCPSANEICPNIKLNIVNYNDNMQGTGLYLTNYSSQNVGFSNIYYSGNLQFSQSNGNLLMTCPSSDCSYYESKLNDCEDLLDEYGSDLDSCESELNICSSALSSCLSGGNSELTGQNWSALFINDIQHLGKSIINITIPSEIGWDYTTDETEFNLNVSGYNQDSDYIEGLIEIQNVKPSNEDLNKIISEIIPLFVPGLLIILFIYFVFRFIKKIF